jgi:hypothetical protein
MVILITLSILHNLNSLYEVFNVRTELVSEFVWNILTFASNLYHYILGPNILFRGLVCTTILRQQQWIRIYFTTE